MASIHPVAPRPSRASQLGRRASQYGSDRTPHPLRSRYSGLCQSPSRSSSLQGNSWQLRPARTTRPGTSTIGFDNTPKQNPRLESAEVPEARRSRTIPWRDQLGRRRHLRRLARDGSCAVGGVEDGIRFVARTVHSANAELTAADFGFLASASCSAA